MFILSKFAENLKDLIFDARLTRKELAEKTGLEEASICRYLKGNCMPNLRATVILADFFNCSVDFLIGKSQENGNIKFLPCPPFSERLNYYLQKFNGSGYKLCKTVGLPDNKFYGWLAGTNYPRIDNVEKLANYFKCTIDQFLGREK